ncbi:hypothetical protein KEM56_005505 [Ascosphaera pollenicola]|nr:hypothetical protein KEM56_005505 [Ascosphaera pollenicola]
MLQHVKATLDEKRAGRSASELLRHAPKRILRGLPSVLLAVMLNTLDASSAGLLVFPPVQESPAFGNLQAQAVAIYVMSTIVSQLVLTLGGSKFPGALGGMLVEVLPFLRALASDIQGVMGKDNPKLVPTVVVAYAMTSVLIGLAFSILGLLRLGWTVEYIPTTVLNGTIAALGLSLFVSGLQLTVPPTAPPLTFGSVQEVLLSQEHIPLLFASVLPAIALCVTTRVSWLIRALRGITEHPLYVSSFMLMIAVVFWVVAASCGLANSAGMDDLAAKGWLFTVDAATKNQSGLGNAWNYFKLFDFSMVEWSAMKAGIGNIVLLVLITVLNLPIYIPAMGLLLKQPGFINMNWELLGHGISNILSGLVGSLPNLIVLSSSRLFTFAGGGRPEGLATTFLTLVTFFCSGRLLRVLPTIMAAVLVCYCALELMIEALWCTAHELLWTEWLIAVGTMLACTFIGFLQGFALGMASAVIMYCLWNFIDMRATRVRIDLRQNAPLVPEEPHGCGKHSSFIDCYLEDDSKSFIRSSSDFKTDRVSSSTLTPVLPTTSLSEDGPLAEVIAVYGHAFFGMGPVSEEFADSVECYFDLYDGISSTQNGAHTSHWLERLFLDFDIGHLLKSQRATIHQFERGQGLELHEPSFILAVRGTVKLTTSPEPFSPDVTRRLEDEEHVARLPLFVALKMGALKFFMWLSRCIQFSYWFGTHDRGACVADEETSLTGQQISLRGGIHTLRSGDTYWPEVDHLHYEGKPFIERLTALEDESQVLVLPVEGPWADSYTTRELLQYCERQSMYKRTLARAVWKF